MTAKLYSDKIIERARDIRVMVDHQGKHTIKAALLDITLDTATTLVNRTAQLVEQQEYDLKKQDRLMRELRSQWHAIQRNVCAVYEDHPINDRHLYAVLAAYQPTLLKRWPKLLPPCMAPEHKHYLSDNGIAGARQRIGVVLDFYVGI